MTKTSSDSITCNCRTPNLHAQKNKTIQCRKESDITLFSFKWTCDDLVCECFAALKSRNSRFSRKYTSKRFFFHILSLLPCYFATLVDANKQTLQGEKDSWVSIKQKAFLWMQNTDCGSDNIIMRSTGLNAALFLNGLCALEGTTASANNNNVI